MERRINAGLAAIAIGSIALMVVLSIHGLNDRAKAREIARMPVVKLEPVTIVGERQVALQPGSTKLAGTQGEGRTQVR